jgi:hypothetical protein
MEKECGAKINIPRLNGGNIYLMGYSAHHPDPLNVNQINLSAVLLKDYLRSLGVSSIIGNIRYLSQIEATINKISLDLWLLSKFYTFRQ